MGRPELGQALTTLVRNAVFVVFGDLLHLGQQFYSDETGDGLSLPHRSWGRACDWWGSRPWTDLFHSQAAQHTSPQRHDPAWTGRRPRICLAALAAAGNGRASRGRLRRDDGWFHAAYDDSIPILGVWPTMRQVVGVIGALACLSLLMLDYGRHSVPITDILLTFSVPLTYSIANSVIRRSLQHLPPLELTMVCLMAAGAVLVPLALAVQNHRPANPESIGSALLAVATLGIVGTGIATFLFNRLVQEQGPLFAGMTTNMVPIGAVLWGGADGEAISLLQMVALLGILIMVTFVQTAPRKRQSEMSASSVVPVSGSE